MASKLATVALTVATLFAVAALCFGLAAIGSILYPGGSGEWAGFGVFFACVLVLPIALVTLASSLFVKSAPRGLRRACAIVSILALLTPVVAQVAWHFHWRGPLGS
jgi:hypothetical protein